MTPPLNQIVDLHIWIHPDFITIDDATLDSWENHITYLKDQSQIGLIETSTSYSWKTKSMVPSRIRNERLDLIAEYASEALGERYQFWDKGPFVEPNEPEHYKALVEKFNVSERSFADNGAKTLFHRIESYGLMPNTCVKNQSAFASPVAVTSRPNGYVMLNRS